MGTAGCSGAEVIAVQQWFASILMDGRGAWVGRALRSPNVSGISSEDQALLQQWTSSLTNDYGLIALPASLAEVSPDAGWVEQTALSAASPTLLSIGPRSVYVDTARVPGWSFPPSDGLPASTSVWADTGWLLNRSPVRGGAARQRDPLPLIQLLADIERDADTRLLEQAFRADPELSYQLLRILNSAAFGTRQQVQGLAHAITLLGRRQLQRWLQLLVYAQSGVTDPVPNPLLLLAAYRGCLLENVARHLRASAEIVDAAYMVGIFSLLDRLIDQPLAKIVAPLPLPAVVIAALVHGSGEAGMWLALVEAAERGELNVAAGILERLEIESADWLTLQDQAFCWSFGLEQARGDAA